MSNISSNIKTNTIRTKEYIVDSGSRNKQLYPSPCKFKYPITELPNAISKVELTGVAIPRSELNVSTHNAFIPFNVDDYVTAVKISERGYGYVPGVYQSDSLDEYLTVSEPGIFVDGAAPVCTAVFNNELLESVEIVSSGKLLFNGRFDRKITAAEVGAEVGAVDANITLIVENNTLVEILVNDPGSGWKFGVNRFGSALYDTGLLFQYAGEMAVIEVTVGIDTSIASVRIVTPGKGYVLGNYNNKIVSGCLVDINIPTAGDNVTKGSVTVSVGELRIAELRPGQYAVDNDHDGLPGLCREVTRAFRQASSVDMFPYTVMTNGEPATIGSCSVINSNPNATLSKKIVVRRGESLNTDGNSANLELLFGTYTENSAGGLLGFGSASSDVPADSICGLTSDYKLYREGFNLVDPLHDFFYQDLNVVGNTIFNLNDTPDYVVVKLNGTPSLQKFISENDTLNGSSFLAVFKTGIDNVYSDQVDSQFQKLDILGSTEIIIDPPKKMAYLDIEILKPNGDLYGTTRDLLLTFHLTAIN